MMESLILENPPPAMAGPRFRFTRPLGSVAPALLVVAALATSAIAYDRTSLVGDPNAGSDVFSLVEDDLPMVPLMPGEPTLGPDVLYATPRDGLGPMLDPNADGMPAFPDADAVDMPVREIEEIGLVEVPEEAEGRMWRIRPIIATGVTYDDNIFITNTDRKGDLIYNIEAGFSFDLGDYRAIEDNVLMLELLATGFFFNEYSAQNSLNMSSNLFGQYRFNQSVAQLESSLQFLDGAQRQVGAFTTRMLFLNALRFVYEYSDKTEVEFEVNQRTSYYPDNLSSYFYEASTAADYLVFPKTTLGLQGKLGLADVQSSPDMWYQTINVRFNYALAGKLAVKASGGAQFNEYVSGGEPMRIVPVFSVGAEYLLFPKTTLNLLAYRNLQASPSLVGQDYIATGGELGMSQEFASNLAFALAMGFENDTYVANTVAADATRVDNFYFFQPRISYNFLKYLKASLSYEYRANDSTAEIDTWYDNRMNLELSGDF